MSQSIGDGLRVSRIEIDDLFGRYSYRIPDREQDISRFLILYGDNGSGKTTILRLLFAVLYPLAQKGQKTYIAQVPFRRFLVEFNNGTSITLQRKSKLLGSYSFRLQHAGGKELTVEVVANSENIIKSTENPKLPAIFEELRALNLFLIFMPDDRKIHSTESQEEYTENEGFVFAPDMSLAAVRRIVDRQTNGSADVSHHLNVAPTLEQVHAIIRQGTLASSREGEKSAISIYEEVVDRISHLWEGSDPPQSYDLATISESLKAIEKKTEDLAVFGFANLFPSENFLRAIERSTPSQRDTILGILDPYISGLNARLTALASIFNLTRRYVEAVNSFLQDKRMSFSVSEGFKISVDSGTPLAPDMLSSGERQIILLLSQSVMAFHSPGIVIIDEPELSLNIKWQRKLLDALAWCAGETSIQYIMASHSLELISQKDENVVRLWPRGVVEI